MNRIAGAPISWGVCEVPGWGFQLGSQQVLTEMREVGLTATELGPDGFLPADNYFHIPPRGSREIVLRRDGPPGPLRGRVEAINARSHATVSA